MAWLTLTMLVIAVLSALLPTARRLAFWAAGSCAAIGVAGLAFGESAAWSLSLLTLGLVAAIAATPPQRVTH